MKKILGLLAFVLLLNGCNDGDVKVQNISFENVVASSTCSNLVYKIKGNETLIITTDLLAAFKNEITAVGVPRSIAIGTTAKVIYRNYNGVPTGNSFCVTPPQAYPSVVEEWNAIGGTMEVTTTAQITTDIVTNATRIVGYNHFIVFKNVTFQKPSGSQVYSSFVFGNFATSTTLTFPFGTPIALTRCSSGMTNTVYGRYGSEAIVINNIDPNLIINTVTPAIRTGLIGNAINIISYKIYNATLPIDFFCAVIPPTVPTFLEQWNADAGTSNIIGSIEVTTVTNGPQFIHQIHLKGATLRKSSGLTFYLGDDYYLGDLSY